MRSPSHRLLNLEARLAEVAQGLADGTLPRHEAAAWIHNASDELASVRAAWVDFQTRTTRNAAHTDNRRNNA